MPLIPPLRRRNGNQPETLPDEQQAFARSCADLGDDRIGRYGLYEDYYDGEQRTRLVDRARTYLEQSGIKFAENIVETGVDKFARNFRVLGFEVEDNPEASDWLTRRLWGRQDELQGIVHTETPKLGDGFVLVTWAAARGRPRLTWNRPHLHKPVYDDDGELLYDVKKWCTTQRSEQNPAGAAITRLNVYKPDRVEKYYSVDRDGENWERWRDKPDEPWPMPWTESDTLPDDGSDAHDPLGILAVHFRNRPKGRRYGRAETRGMIPYQDELNKQILDLFYVMDAQGWAWPWVTGYDATADQAIKMAVGDILLLSKENAKVGSISPADPRPALEAIDATLRRFSLKTDTPLFDLIKGTPPSGEALKTARSGQVSKVLDTQTSHGHSWEKTASLAWRLAWLFGADDVPDFDPDADITTLWDSPEIRDEQVEATTALAYSDLGVSNTTLQRRLGFDPEQEAELRAEEAPAEPPPPGA